MRDNDDSWPRTLRYKTVSPYATRTTSCSVRDVLAVIDFISISPTTAAHLLAIAPPINERAIEVSWFASGYERSPAYRKIQKLLLRSS